MEAYKYLKELYTGNKAIYNHITLFSLLGIMVIFLNNLAASWGSSLYIDIFAIPPSTSFELWLAVVGGGVVAIYLFGYSYEYIHSLFKREECSLSDFDLTPFKTFFRVFPMFFLWQNYLILFSIIGFLIIFSFDNIWLLAIFTGIVILLIPFVHLILISFCSRFKYRISFFYPWLIFRYIDKTLGNVFILILQILLLALTPIAIITLLVIGSSYIDNEVLKFAIELACLCFGIYCTVVLSYVISAGFVKIVKNKLMP